MSVHRYVTQSGRLAAAGRQLLNEIQTNRTPSEKIIAELDDASVPPGPEFGYSAKTGQVQDTESVLSDILLEFQAATVLLSSGVALEARNREAGTSYLNQAVNHIELAQDSLAAPAPLFGFSAGSHVQSFDLESAKKNFREDATFALDQFVSDTESLVTSVFEQLKKLDAQKVLDGIQNLGGSVQFVADAGRLVSRGIEKLKRAIQWLTDFLNSGGALQEVKQKVSEVCQRLTSGEYAREVLAFIYGVGNVKTRLDELLASPGLDLSNLDAASNALRPLSEDFGKGMKIIRAILGTVTLAISALGVFHITFPWMPLATAIAYAALLGSGLVTGMAYCGRPVLPWVKGVIVIVNGIPHGAPSAVHP